MTARTVTPEEPWLEFIIKTRLLPHRRVSGVPEESMQLRHILGHPIEIAEASAPRSTSMRPMSAPI